MVEKCVTEKTNLNDMDYRLLVDTAVLAGEIMLVAGAETHRVEDTVGRILRLSGFERCDVMVVTAGIVVTMADWRRDTISVMRRVGEKKTNLGNIAEVNDISRKLCQGKLELKQAFHMLKHLNSQRYPEWLVYICMIVAAPGFTILLGGNMQESLIAALNGIYAVCGMHFNQKYKMNVFVMNMMVSCLMAFTARGFLLLPGIDIELERVVAGSVMMLLPGVAITNAIRDTLHTDYMAGGAKIIEAFVVAASVGVGIGAGLALGAIVFGGGMV